MSELSKRDIERLAESNVGLLAEVQEAIALLAAALPAIQRATKACRTEERANAAKSASDGDAIADATAGVMSDVAAKFRIIAGVVEDLNRYL